MAGKSTQIYSVQIREATTAGGDQDDNFLPDVSAAATAVGMATTTATVDGFAGAGEEAFHIEEQGRRTPGENKPSAIGVINGSASAKFGAANGEFIRAMYPDEISLAHRFRTPDGADPESFAFGQVLNSSLGLYKPPAATVTCAAASTDGGEFIIPDNDALNMHIGSPVRVFSQDSHGNPTFVHEYAIITAKTSDGTNTTCTVHPEFGHTPAQNDTIQLCYAFYPVVGTDDTQLGKDVHAIFDMGGTGSQASVRRIASGCRLSGFSISNDNSGASLSMSLRPLVMLTDDDNASTATVNEPGGALLQHRYGCRVDLCSDHSGVASGTAVSGTRTFLPNFDHGVEVSIDGSAGAPETRGVVRGATHEIHNQTCALNITMEGDGKNDGSERPAVTLQRMISRDQLRTIIVGYGPGGSGASNKNGGAFIIKNASRSDGTASPSAGDGNRIQMQVSLRAVSDFAQYSDGGHALGTSELNLASAPFILVLPRA